MDGNGSTPVFSSESNNNGIMGYTSIEPDYLINDNNPFFIIFGDHTISFNISKVNFCVADNVKVLRLKKIVGIKTLLYIITTWKKGICNKGYSRHWSIAKNVKFQLPLTSNGEINFPFMENFIAELEAERIAELEAYLLATGLKDTTLTDEEKHAIKVFENTKRVKCNNIEWKDFNITDIFKIKNSRNILSRDIVVNSGNTPYLCASCENNSISSYISYDKSYIDTGNCIFIGGKTFVVTYQEDDFYSNDSHNLILYLQDEKNKNKSTQLFLATCINKSLKHKYSWGDSVSKAKIQKDKVTLPAKNNQLDFNFMQTFISAVQKLVIKDVVLYADEKIKATKHIIQKQNH